LVPCFFRFTLAERLKLRASLFLLNCGTDSKNRESMTDFGTGTSIDSQDAAADEADGDSIVWVHQTGVLAQGRPSHAALASRASALGSRATTWPAAGARSMCRSGSWAWTGTRRSVVALGTRPATVGLDRAHCLRHCRSESACHGPVLPLCCRSA